MFHLVFWTPLDAGELATLKYSMITFAVDTDGSIVDVEMKETSGDVLLDAKIVEVVKQIPDWSPAKDVDGNLVKQSNIQLIVSNRTSTCSN